MKLPSSKTIAITSRMSYGSLSTLGMIELSASSMRSGGSWGTMGGGSSLLFCGRYESSRLTASTPAISVSVARCATPLRPACTCAPPSDWAVTSSPVTVLITSGPVRNIELSEAMITKSVRAGEYTAPPAQGPRISEICGITPEAITLRTNTSPYAARLRTPSWMRAPPESLRPISGMPLCSARSWIRQILCDWTSENEPPSTVKSCANTATRRPLTLPKPVTMPSPGKRCLSRPNSVTLWVASAPNSWNES